MTFYYFYAPEKCESSTTTAKVSDFQMTRSASRVLYIFLSSTVNLANRGRMNLLATDRDSKYTACILGVDCRGILRGRENAGFLRLYLCAVNDSQ